MKRGSFFIIGIGALQTLACGGGSAEQEQAEPLSSVSAMPSVTASPTPQGNTSNTAQPTGAEPALPMAMEPTPTPTMEPGAPATTPTMTNTVSAPGAAAAPGVTDPGPAAGGAGGQIGMPPLAAAGTGGQAGTEGQPPMDDPQDNPMDDTGANFPFPQNLASEHCVYASNYDNADVQAAYDLWKETVVTNEGAGEFLRVRKPDSGTVIDSTVSEGMGYGMLLTVYMNDQEIFDQLWRYTMQYFNENDLMHWEIDPQGSVIGTGAALDGDEDMAWALVMADRQWGGSGSLDDTYHNYAVALIEAMWQHEIDHSRGEMPLPGDSWGGQDVTNISYFAPAYYRVFGQVTGNESGWNAAIDRSYEILNLSLTQQRGNADNGLVPAWCDSNGVPTEAYAGAPLHFQNDSTRTPFRFGQDYCYYGEPRALEYMQKITSFYTSVGVGNIVDGYDLDGTPHPDFSVNGLQPASFVGPAAVGAMYSADNQAFIDEAYAAIATTELTAGTIYYQKSWSALSLLMLTGNFTELPAR